KIMDSFVSIRSHGALISPNKGQQDNCSERTMHEWPQLRRQELCSAPQFIVNGATRLDVCQGALNDCWLLSAIASLSVNRFLLNKVMPLEQSFKDGYKGCFTFSFWQYGQWEEVKIDDFLPTKDNKLIYLSSPERDEFWSALLEKAYAKLKGGYRALDMGFPHEAMVDMTGGVTEVFNISLLPQDLPAFLRHLLARGALINCANCQGPLEQSNGLGIMFRHAYSLTAVEQVKTAHGIVDLVRILNPWGNTEWSGPWSDLKGPEWEAVNKEEQKRLERVKREDGEFWMSVSDFRRHFETMEVCHLTDSLSETGSSVLPWCCVMHHGNWVPSISAGGSAQGGKKTQWAIHDETRPSFLLTMYFFLSPPILGELNFNRFSKNRSCRSLNLFKIVCSNISTSISYNCGISSTSSISSNSRFSINSSRNSWNTFSHSSICNNISSSCSINSSRNTSSMVVEVSVVVLEVRVIFVVGDRMFVIHT
uniref:Calpain catalytic domain-containing protein n=1 Tax=Gasterosteus aculeatus aculeatus TaxID=481459 RepID=A0AAQ4Q327_GASAC